MQIEGFWYFLFMGTYQAAVLHYAIAKIFGPLIFGRAWCGYACWTAMVLDLLPYKAPEKPTRDKYRVLRYLLFIVAFIYVGTLFLFYNGDLHEVMYISFIAGNIIYYAAGILMAFLTKDNRAFCKYLCPITTFLKPMSYFSLARVKVDESKCVKCNKCLRVCPMEVNILDNRRSRKNGTECILCQECITACPKKALHV